MGGQACVLYGAAEFSRDLDLCVLSEPANLERLRAALSGLEAEVIAVPPFSAASLGRGHAIHFRCRREDVAGVRIDVMSRLRGVDTFAALWDRRTVIESREEKIDVLSLPDLVKAKKTQHDKDWPMIRRLLEQHYFRTPHPSEAQLDFWFAEMRTPELLLELCQTYPEAAARHSARRPAVAASGLDAVRRELELEERAERQADAAYWRDLRQELERFRAEARRPAP